MVVTASTLNLCVLCVACWARLSSDWYVELNNATVGRVDHIWSNLMCVMVFGVWTVCFISSDLVLGISVGPF